MANHFVSGESGWLSITRGVLALLAICLMAAFGVYQIVLSPIAEIGVTRYKQFRARGLAGDHLNFDLAVSGHWTVVVVSSSDYYRDYLISDFGNCAPVDVA